MKCVPVCSCILFFSLSFKSNQKTAIDITHILNVPWGPQYLEEGKGPSDQKKSERYYNLLVEVGFAPLTQLVLLSFEK